jgi:hypothetical protein
MTRSRDDLMLDLSRAVDELTRPRTNSETYQVHDGVRWQNRRHNVRVASLLDQLRLAVEANSTMQDGPRPAFGSKPAARLEAIDRLTAIDSGAAIWATRHLGQSARENTEGNLRTIVGQAAELEDEPLAALVREVTRWRVWARVVTGWDEPPYRPHNACPLCGVKGSLRIRVIDRYAACVDCGEAWGPDSIMLLAEHIRWENNDEPLEAAG